MFFAWLKRRRRRKLLARPFSSEWQVYLTHNVVYYQFLTDAERAKLHDDMRIFVAEKRWEGCGGLMMTTEIKVTIAAQACLLMLALEPDSYERVQSILVYPTGYLGPSAKRDGITGLEFDEPRLGEAWYRGPVVLSWVDVLRDGSNPDSERNLVFHEFAHQLDMLDGLVDGTPLLRDPEQVRRWREVMPVEYARLVEESAEGRATLLDTYGTANEGEFFAVATECFFTQGARMRRRHPQLYDLLRNYYRQDPAAWRRRNS